MDFEKREYIISRIIWGFMPFKFCGYNYLIGQPTTEDVFYAEQIYQDTIEDSKFTEIMCEAELRNWMVENNLWSVEEEESLTNLEKDIEEFKVQLFQNIMKSNDRIKIKEYLKIAREEQKRLLDKKHSYDYTCKEGLAKNAKSNFLLSQCIYNNKKVRVLDVSADLLGCAIHTYTENGLSDKEYRELARTEPWRSIWSANTGNIFNAASIELSAERRSLILWSKMYDNIYDHPECPHSSIVEDDDTIDGWMLIQKRKREKEQSKQDAESLITNDKIRNAGEIFVFAQTKDDAKKIEALNNPAARIIKQQRERHILQHGATDITALPDVRNELNAQAHEEYVNKVKGTT